MSKQTKNLKSVVIVGGGAAGVSLAKSLSSKLDPSRHSLTVITSRPFYVLLPSLVRITTFADEELANKALMPFDHVFANGNGKVVVGTVVRVDDHTEGGNVILDNGESVSYDVLVLATGSRWNVVHAPNTRDEVKSWMKLTSDSIRNAKSIVLVGGGAIGTEFSGEIKDIDPEKEVTIVHADKLLMNKAYPEKFRKAMTASVLARGTKIVFDDYVDNFPEPGVPELTTRRGKTLKADLVLRTTGPKPATAFLSSLPSVLTSGGYVRVKPTLQIVDHPHIFAAGDIIDWDEQKQAAKVHGHAGVITENVLSILGGNEAKKEYKGAYELIVVTNGKNGGVAYFGVLWGLVFGDWVARLLKSKTLLIPMARKSIGLKD